MATPDGRRALKRSAISQFIDLSPAASRLAAGACIGEEHPARLRPGTFDTVWPLPDDARRAGRESVGAERRDKHRNSG